MQNTIEDKIEKSTGLLTKFRNLLVINSAAYLVAGVITSIAAGGCGGPESCSVPKQTLEDPASYDRCHVYIRGKDNTYIMTDGNTTCGYDEHCECTKPEGASDLECGCDCEPEPHDNLEKW